jgi:hypothetical protein
MLFTQKALAKLWANFNLFMLKNNQVFLPHISTWLWQLVSDQLDLLFMHSFVVDNLASSDLTPNKRVSGFTDFAGSSTPFGRD